MSNASDARAESAATIPVPAPDGALGLGFPRKCAGEVYFGPEWIFDAESQGAEWDTFVPTTQHEHHGPVVIVPADVADLIAVLARMADDNMTAKDLVDLTTRMHAVRTILGGFRSDDGAQREARRQLERACETVSMARIRAAAPLVTNHAACACLRACSHRPTSS